MGFHLGLLQGNSMLYPFKLCEKRLLKNSINHLAEIDPKIDSVFCVRLILFHQVCFFISALNWFKGTCYCWYFMLHHFYYYLCKTKLITIFKIRFSFPRLKSVSLFYPLYGSLAFFTKKLPKYRAIYVHRWIFFI
jgi:hypothetical protein